MFAKIIVWITTNVFRYLKIWLVDFFYAISICILILILIFIKEKKVYSLCSVSAGVLIQVWKRLLCLLLLFCFVMIWSPTESLDHNFTWCINCPFHHAALHLTPFFIHCVSENEPLSVYLFFSQNAKSWWVLCYITSFLVFTEIHWVLSSHTVCLGHR